MGHSETTELAERVRRLERENRWLKRVGCVVLVGILALVARRSRA